MSKAGISLDIPGFGLRHISKLLTDYTGTLSCGGRLTVGVRESLNKIAEASVLHDAIEFEYNYLNWKSF
jgi:hypothetical protein